jgi:hypothetical protein
VPAASSFSLKAFRAGKATALAAKGHAYSKILAAGQWASGAALRYIDDDVVDINQALFVTIDNSDDDA